MTYRLDKSASKIEVWTYKEGLLSKVAHDLVIDATQFTVNLSDRGEQVAVSVAVPVRSLKVRGAVKGSLVTPLKDKDHREIEENMLGKKVLLGNKHGEIRFDGRAALKPGHQDVLGQLNVKGMSRSLSLSLTIDEKGDGYTVSGDCRFDQRDFGIKPFSALMGTIKIKPEIRVSWSLSVVPA
jgi:polyisoprenoid-binding protein YceI